MTAEHRNLCKRLHVGSIAKCDSLRQRKITVDEFSVEKLTDGSYPVYRHFLNLLNFSELQKWEDHSSYKDKLDMLISTNTFFEDTAMDYISLRQDDKNYTLKSSKSEGEDYWVIQHYKTDNLVDVAPKDRWKHSDCSIKFTMSNHISRDVSIKKKLHTYCDRGHFGTFHG